MIRSQAIYFRSKHLFSYRVWKHEKIVDKSYSNAVGDKRFLKNDYYHSKRYQGKVKAVIFDWAGTVVDCGCLAPVATFVELFKKDGVEISVEEARRPMGLHKRDHIERLLFDENISNRWVKLKGIAPTVRDVDRMYDSFVPQQFISIRENSSVIEGVPDTVHYLRNTLKLKIGSCSGYPKVILQELIRTAALEGFSPDFNVAADEVPLSRPCPFMIWLNAINLGVYPMESIIKVDDTVEGIREGISAGCWTVGVAKTGNYVGASSQALASMSPEKLANNLQRAYRTLLDSGAHYVIDSVNDLPAVIADINNKMSF